MQGRPCRGTITAAAMCCVVAVPVLLARCQSTQGAPHAGATHTATPAATGLPSPSGAATSAATEESGCTSADLSARVGTSQDALGTQVTPVLIRNDSAAPCTVGGLPTLLGVRADGTRRTLPYAASADPSIVRQPPRGPGIVEPGQSAEILVFDQLNNCATANTAANQYRSLEIRMAGGAAVTLPFPAAPAGPGCPAQVSQVGRSNN